MIRIIVVLIVSFVWAFIDSFLLFIPPVTFGVSALMTQTSYPVISTLINGIAIGLGTVCAIIFYRKIGHKIKGFETNEKVNKWRNRVTILVDEIGYQMIIPLAATSLINMVCYTFLFAKHINYKKLFLYVVVGRTLLLAITAFGVLTVTTGESIQLIVSAIIYLIMFVYIIFVLIKHRHVIKLIKEMEANNEESNKMDN